VGLISTWFFIANQYALLITMVLVGVAWASTLAMPYAILASKLPQHKLGFYMGIFNFFIVLPQIAAALGGKYLISMLGNNTLAAIVLAGCSMITAALFMQLVHDDPSPREEVS
jgi:maltose/moltooligosaccharide transporter